MQNEKPIIKRELHRIIKRFLLDKKRGISIPLFAEVCGISPTLMKDIFIYDREPITERTQWRVSKGYRAWLNGEIRIMQNRDKTKFTEYRREPTPRLARSTGLQVVNGEIKIKVGIVNKADYSGYSLDEQLNRG
jgi:hypothetical protein